MVVATRAVKAWNEVSQPETLVKGDEFGDFIRKNLFPDDGYDLLARTGDYAPGSSFVPSPAGPDFTFRSRKKGNVFLVEAVFCPEFTEGAVQWCQPYQLSRYEALNKASPLYIVIGVGRLPSSPAHVYLVPVKFICRYPRLFHSFLIEYELPRHRPVGAEKLIVLLMNG